MLIAVTMSYLLFVVLHFIDGRAAKKELRKEGRTKEVRKEGRTYVDVPSRQESASSLQIVFTNLLFR